MIGDCFSALQWGVSRRRGDPPGGSAGRQGRVPTAGRPPGARLGGRGERPTPGEGLGHRLEPTPPAFLFASTGGRGRSHAGLCDRLRGARRRASDLLALPETIQDAPDHGGLGDESHHAHLASAARAHEGVDFVDAADHLRPSALRAARSAPSGVVAPWGASLGQEGSAGAAACLRLARAAFE